MAHHIAELIQSAAAETDSAERRRKEREAAGAISRLWSHRAKYENRINPLWELRPILQVLRTLDPQQNVWISFVGASGGVGLPHLYEVFRRLIIALLMHRVSTDKIRAAVDSARTTSTFQDAAEREIVEVIGHWLTDNDRKRISRRVSRRLPKDQQGSLDYIRALIADARDALDSIEKELGEPVEGMADGHTQRRKR